MKRSPIKRSRPKRSTVEPAGVYRCAGEMLLPGGCYPGPESGLHRHHVQRRSQGGPDTPENLIYLCQHHHGYVHDNPGIAKLHGFLR